MTKAERAARRICEAENILLICHVSPDGDAIGSLLGLGLALQLRKKHVTMVCADPVPDQCRHLPHWETVTDSSLYADRSQSSYRISPFDLVVSLDCSDLARLGKAYDAELLDGVPIVNIDHHATNLNFGEINWVEPTAAATSQMLVPLIQALHIPLNPDIATCLLGGILTDTLGFRTSNTTAQVLETATQLVSAGALLSELTDRIFNHRPMSTIQMWALALQGLCLEGRILWTEITQAIRQRTGYKEDGGAGLVHFLNTANEADISVVFDELADGQINVSMRAVPGYDVSHVALTLGGGGHTQAAGCTLSGPRDSARTQVLSMLRQAWVVQTSQQ